MIISSREPLLLELINNLSCSWVRANNSTEAAGRNYSLVERLFHPCFQIPRAQKRNLFSLLCCLASERACSPSIGERNTAARLRSRGSRVLIDIYRSINYTWILTWSRAEARKRAFETRLAIEEDGSITSHCPRHGRRPDISASIAADRSIGFASYVPPPPPSSAPKDLYRMRRSGIIG